MCPSLTSSSPASIRKVVDLPQPDGPTSTMNSPSAISRSMPGTAGESAPGYHRCAFSKVTLAMTYLLHRQERAGRSVVGCDGHYPEDGVSCDVAHMGSAQTQHVRRLGRCRGEPDPCVHEQGPRDGDGVTGGPGGAEVHRVPVGRGSDR